MKRNWMETEMAKCWELSDDELTIVKNKRGVTRLGFSILLKFFQIEGRFPSGASEIPLSVVRFVSRQLEVDPMDWSTYPWEGRILKYHRAEIRDWCGFREITLADQEVLKRWLVEAVIPLEPRVEGLREALLQRCRALQIEPPSGTRAAGHPVCPPGPRHSVL